MKDEGSGIRDQGSGVRGANEGSRCPVGAVFEWRLGFGERWPERRLGLGQTASPNLVCPSPSLVCRGAIGLTKNLDWRQRAGAGRDLVGAVAGRGGGRMP